MTPLELVQRQFDAYNAHDIDQFSINFSENFVAYRMPSNEPSIVGKAHLIKYYTENRFNLSGLKAELISRVVMGNKVFDYEVIFGINESPIESFAIFEISNNLISTAWFYFRD